MLGILDDFYYLEGIGCFGVILVFLFILNDYIVVIVKYTQLLPNTLKVNIGLKVPKSFLNNLFMYPDFGGNSRNLSTPPLSAAQPTWLRRVLGQGYGASDQVAWTCPHSLLVVMFFLCLVGGFNPSENISQLELFQIYPNIWEKKSSKPPTRC